jgi:putative membrane protein insertion efficiency factor
VKKLVLAIIWVYQATLSAVIGPRCRFYPSCSRYAMEAIETHGLIKGAMLSVRRIGKCHPFHPGGVDMVPKQTVPQQSVPQQSVALEMVPQNKGAS